MLVDTHGVSQYLVFTHEHREIFPDLTDPYGLFSYKVLGPKSLQTMDAKIFVMKDYLYKSLSRKDLSCRSSDNVKEPSYEGGIGTCIDSMKSENKV